MRQFRVCDSVEAYGLEKALDRACIDLDRVDKMSDTEACAFCNTDTKEEALEVIQEEIDYIEFQLIEWQYDRGIDSIRLLVCKLQAFQKAGREVLL